jgi:hypothetical protein
VSSSLLFTVQEETPEVRTCALWGNAGGSRPASSVVPFRGQSTASLAAMSSLSGLHSSRRSWCLLATSKHVTASGHSLSSVLAATLNKNTAIDVPPGIDEMQQSRRSGTHSRIWATSDTDEIRSDERPSPAVAECCKSINAAASALVQRVLSSLYL